MYVCVYSYIAPPSDRPKQLYLAYTAGGSKLPITELVVRYAEDNKDKEKEKDSKDKDKDSKDKDKKTVRIHLCVNGECFQAMPPWLWLLIILPIVFSLSLLS